MPLDAAHYNLNAASRTAHFDAAAAFGEVAKAYEDGRPLYPIATIQAVAKHLQKGSVLIDMGAGNGRTLRSVFQHVAPDHFRYVQAVEPARKMHVPLRQSLWNVPNLHTLTGSFENIPASDQSADNIICGASIHWGTATPADAQRTKQEMCRVLKPDGRLILLTDQWDHTGGISQQLYELQERCFEIFQERQGYPRSLLKSETSKNTKPNVRTLYTRLKSLIASEEQRQFQQREEGILSFLDHNGLGEFFDRVWGGVHTEEMTLSPTQIHQEFASQIYVSNLTPQEQSELHEYLSVLLDRYMNDDGNVTCKRACLSVSGTLAR